MSDYSSAPRLKGVLAGCSLTLVYLDDVTATASSVYGVFILLLGMRIVVALFF